VQDAYCRLPQLRVRTRPRIESTIPSDCHGSLTCWTPPVLQEPSCTPPCRRPPRNTRWKTSSLLSEIAPRSEKRKWIDGCIYGSGHLTCLSDCSEKREAKKDRRVHLWIRSSHLPLEVFDLTPLLAPLPLPLASDLAKVAVRALRLLHPSLSRQRS